MVIQMAETIYRIFIMQNYIQFSFQLIVCEIPFLIGMQKKKNFGIRAAAAAVLYLIAAGTWCNLLTPLGRDGSFLPYVFVYFGYAVLTGLAVKVMFESGWMEITFIVASGYASEHMCFALSRMFLYVTGKSYEVYGSLAHAFLTRYVK